MVGPVNETSTKGMVWLGNGKGKMVEEGWHYRQHRHSIGVRTGHDGDSGRQGGGQSGGGVRTRWRRGPTTHGPRGAEEKKTRNSQGRSITLGLQLGGTGEGRRREYILTMVKG